MSDFVRNHSFKTCADKYENFSHIGQGAFGFVVQANKINQPEKIVAIKKISSFDHEVFCRRTLREIQIILTLDHYNIISIVDIIRDQSLETYQDLSEIFLVFEFMESDLHNLLKSQQLSNQVIQAFSYQIIAAIKYIHSADIIHRDLKPGNILINSDCVLKICDFGLARKDNSETASKISNQNSETSEPSIDPAMTQYVATRWYRAPEVLLSEGNYSKFMDIWSVGCIIAEMIQNVPLFPGQHAQHQVSLIFDFLGNPQEAEIESLSTKYIKTYVRRICQEKDRKAVDFRVFNPHADSILVDLMMKMLTFRAENRISAAQAIQHEYFSSIHDPEEEPDAEDDVGENVNEAINNMNLDELKQLLFQETSAEQMYMQNHSESQQ